MIIRKKASSDIEAITQVTTAAFKMQQLSNKTEQFIIKAMRAAAGALTLSLVAKIDGGVVGHVAISTVTISDGIKDWDVRGRALSGLMGKSLIFWAGSEGEVREKIQN